MVCFVLLVRLLFRYYWVKLLALNLQTSVLCAADVVSVRIRTYSKYELNMSLLNSTSIYE